MMTLNCECREKSEKAVMVCFKTAAIEGLRKNAKNNFLPLKHGITDLNLIWCMDVCECFSLPLSADTGLGMV
jgi:hypothetical protein